MTEEDFADTAVPQSGAKKAIEVGQMHQILR